MAPAGERAAAATSPSGSVAGGRSSIDKYGTPEQNPAFWASISPSEYVADLSGPLQLQHASGDEEVPVAVLA